MRNFGIALIAVAALCVASPALATFPSFGGGGGGGDTTNTNDNTNRNHNDNSARSTATGQGLGVGVGIGQGGNARAAGGAGGDANSRSRATGGDADSRSRSGVRNSGNSQNRNSNDSNARVGNVGAYSGVDFEDSRIGNSRNTNDLSNRNRNNVDTNTSTSTRQGQKQKQKQQQGQQQGQQITDSSRVSLDVTDRSYNDNSTFVEAADIPVASAAPVFASACSAGVSGQSMGFGGSLATTNPMCDMALAAEMARAVGNDKLAYELTMEAATFARARTNVVRRFGQWIPFIGSLW